MTSVQEQVCTYTGFPFSFGTSSLQITVYPGTFREILPDANGNVTELINNDGALLAHYEYSAYGDVTAMSGSEAENNPYRFSTNISIKSFRNSFLAIATMTRLQGDG